MSIINIKKQLNAAWSDIVVPKDKQWKILYGHCTYKSGNTDETPRLFGIQINDANMKEIFDIHAGVAQTDDKNAHYELLPGGTRSIELAPSYLVSIPIEFIIIEGWSIGLGNIRNKVNQYDTMDYSLVIEESKHR